MAKLNYVISTYYFPVIIWWSAGFTFFTIPFSEKALPQRLYFSPVLHGSNIVTTYSKGDE
ncbi:MAG: hypothetical protein ABJA71_03920 [Ginsengibacter sp.]